MGTSAPKSKGPKSYYAKVQLAQLDAGKKLATEVTYPVQTWKFGNTLAMVFLPGEVVVDYSLRLKKELDSTRLWINAYSNDAPAYIPSERILKEGGYEGGGAMIYYNLPAPFAAGLEDKIVAAVHAQLDDNFKAHDKKQGTQGNLSKSPAESLATIQVRPGMRVEARGRRTAHPIAPRRSTSAPTAKSGSPNRAITAARTAKSARPLDALAFSKIAIDDGTFETSTVFLDKISEPFGVTVWGKGVLISAAPDLTLCRRHERRRQSRRCQKLFTGFSVENPQARLNSLCYGLDGWLEAGSYEGSKLKSLNGEEIALPNGDFRLQPDLQIIDPETGQTENGRVRDDWGNWFGTDNSERLLSLPLSDRYLRLDLSEADLHFCSSHGAGCGGWYPSFALQSLKRARRVRPGTLPVCFGVHRRRRAAFVLAPDRSQHVYNIQSTSWIVIDAFRKDYLTNHGPMAAVLTIYDDFFSYGGGIYHHVTGAKAGAHCILVVGYSQSQGCWICKNSWGTAWGEAGFFKIAYGECDIDSLFAPFFGVQGIVLPA